MKRIIYLLIVALVFTSCTKKSTEQEKYVNDTDHTALDSELKLNDGERWEANIETTEGINNMLLLIDAFRKDDSADYTALKDNLTFEFTTIFKKCTMKGEAHDQLHNYLLPLKTLIDNASNENVEQIIAYLNTYQNYFK
jgi:hypothetical protein